MGLARGEFDDDARDVGRRGGLGGAAAVLRHVAGVERRDDAAAAVDEAGFDVEVRQEHHLGADLELEAVGEGRVLAQGGEVGLVALVDGVERLEAAVAGGEELLQLRVVDAVDVGVVAVQARRLDAVPGPGREVRVLEALQERDAPVAEAPDAELIEDLDERRVALAEDRREDALLGEATPPIRRLEGEEGAAVAAAAALGHGRELEEVAADQELDAPERLVVAADVARDVLELVEERRFDHADLVDDEGAALLPPLARLAIARDLSREFARRLLREAHAREHVDRRAPDLCRRRPSRRRDEDLARAPRPQRPDRLLERVRLARALRAEVALPRARPRVETTAQGPARGRRGPF